MIVANLATYPARRDRLNKVVESIYRQVDFVNIVLNEYAEIPSDLHNIPNINFIFPPYDLKDVGKFYPDTTSADYIFLLDDDIIYPPDYVARSILHLNAAPYERCVGGYHATTYVKPYLRFRFSGIRNFLNFSRLRILRFRKTWHFMRAASGIIAVDEIGTGTAVLRKTEMPPFSYMDGSQKFVDVRFAKWCFENAITPLCLPRPDNWFAELENEATLWTGFTKKSPQYVIDEIKTYAYRREL